MPDEKEQFQDFTLEVECSGMPSAWRMYPTFVINSPDTSSTEKLMAHHMLEMCKVIDKLVSDLNFGQATVRVYESGITRQPNRDP